MDALGLVMTSMADLIKEEIANPALETVTRTEEVRGLALMVKEKDHQAVKMATAVMKTEDNHQDSKVDQVMDLDMAMGHLEAKIMKEHLEGNLQMMMTEMVPAGMVIKTRMERVETTKDGDLLEKGKMMMTSLATEKTVKEDLFQELMMASLAEAEMAKTKDPLEERMMMTPLATGKTVKEDLFQEPKIASMAEAEMAKAKDPLEEGMMMTPLATEKTVKEAHLFLVMTLAIMAEIAKAKVHSDEMTMMTFMVEEEIAKEIHYDLAIAEVHMVEVMLMTSITEAQAWEDPVI